MKLRDDDESLIAEVTAWGQEGHPPQTACLVLTQMNHKQAVIGRLREEGWRPITVDDLVSPSGHRLYVRASSQMARGTQLDRAWVHPDCPPGVWYAVAPCVRGQ